EVGDPGGPASVLGDVGQQGEGDDLVAADEHAGAVAADAEAGGVDDVDLAGGAAVAEVVQVGVADVEEGGVGAGERADADVGRGQVDDDRMAEEGVEQRGGVGHGGRSFGRRGAGVVRSRGPGGGSP